MLNGSTYYAEAYATYPGLIDVTTLRATSLYNFMSLYVQSLHYLVELPVDLATHAEVHVRFVLRNSKSTSLALQQVEQMLRVFMGITMDSAASVSAVTLALVLVGPLVAVLVALWVAPLLMRIDSARDDMMVRGGLGATVDGSG